MFLNVGVQDSESNIVNASAKVVPHVTYNVIAHLFVYWERERDGIFFFCLLVELLANFLQLEV